jgi:hypothetical protein
MAGRDRLQEEIEELFAELWPVARFAGLRRGFRPNVDCFHTEDPHALTVVVELPGVDPHSLQIVVADRLLVVGGERPRPAGLGARLSADGDRVRPVPPPDPARRGCRPRRRPRRTRTDLTVHLPIVEQPAPGARITIEVREV